MTDNLPQHTLQRRQPVCEVSTKQLDPQDEALHPVLRQTIVLQQEPNALKRFGQSIRMPFRAFGFLVKNRSLWPSVFWPTLINLSLFGVSVYYIWGKASALLVSFWAKPVFDAWYHAFAIAGWHLANVFIHILGVVLAYVFIMIVGAIVTSPFNDIISEKTEEILLGDRYVKHQLPFLPSTLRSIRSTAIIALMYVGCVAPLLVLHLIPGLGSVAYTLIAGTVGGFFIAMEYCDILLERKQFKMRTKFSRVWQERPTTLGFGIGTNLFLAIPLLNFLCIPIAVISGTIVGLALEQQELYGDQPKGLIEDDRDSTQGQ